ncbi:MULTISPECIES: HAMP domain-containing sensor histidine kinase [unclassified Pedobacter]|uniref:GAF domain-containing sensor histidine kinase n=1 Tax=unclassified Pedobacter TaxID=2628915 RepID=UPI001E63419E|nr:MULTISPECIES: HAMP domain-containing sensor histidine kinase [unclassified Pedobacter]
MSETEISETNVLNKENNRLKKLARYEILDTKPELAFNTIANLAANIFESENAAISFVDEENVFYKASASQKFDNVDELCRKVIQNTDVTIVKDNILVPFFIAAPLITPEGFIVGTIHVTSHQKIEPTQKQIEMLKMLAGLVIDKLENRFAMRTTMRTQDNRVNMLVHDLKNPMTTISLQSELIGRMPGLDERSKMIAGKINAQSKNIVESLNHIVSTARSENAAVKLQKGKVDFKSLLNKISNDFGERLNKRILLLKIDAPEVIEVYGDEEKLYLAIEALIKNAIKFSNSGAEIHLICSLSENILNISIIDKGVGIEEGDLEKLFIKFANFNNSPKQLQSSEGLGLLLARTIFELHKGKLWAESAGKDKGTTFHVEIPLR